MHDVALRTRKPSRKRRIPVEHLIPAPVPLELVGHLRPESLGVVCSPGSHCLGVRYDGGLDEGVRRGDPLLLLQDRIQVDWLHARSRGRYGFVTE